MLFYIYRLEISVYI